MTKWEYRTVTLPAFQMEGLASVSFKIDLLEDILKDYGNDGWELASQSFTGDIRYGNGDMVLVFKRPKE